MSQQSGEFARSRARLLGALSVYACVGIVTVLSICVGLIAFALLGFSTAMAASSSGQIGLFFVSLAWASACAALGMRGLSLMLQGGGQPDGVRLPRQAAWSFHSKIRRMSERFEGVRIDEVWITGDMNASVTQIPRYGLVGPMRNHLLIGLPVLHSVTHRQLSAILAHECAHLAFQRRGAAAWLRHVCGWWFRISEALVVEWPWLGAVIDRITLPSLLKAAQLSRVDEFEADAQAAKVVGAELIAEALIEVALRERFLSNDYWHRILDQSRSRARPKMRPYREMAHGMAAGFRPPDDYLSEISSELCPDLDVASIALHPTLCERISALGVSTNMLRAGQTLERTAAERHLKPLLPTLSWVFDRSWWEGTRDSWRQRYRCALRHGSKVVSARRNPS